MVDNVPSVGVLRCSKTPADARDKNIQQRAESLSLAAAFGLTSPFYFRKGKRRTYTEEEGLDSLERESGEKTFLPINSALREQE